MKKSYSAIRISLSVVWVVLVAISLTGCLSLPNLGNLRDLLTQTKPTQAATPTPRGEQTLEETPEVSTPASQTTSAELTTLYDLTSLYDRANPAVVNITVMMRVQVSDSELFPFESQGSEDYLQQSEGSGFVYDLEGHIITNQHVVADAEKVTVTFFDDLAVPATVVGTDPDSDLAVIKVDVDREQLVPLTLGDSDAVRVGQPVVAIGNPFGLAGTMTSGIVSAVGRVMAAGGSEISNYSIPDVIQTDAAINPGNSGGPLLNLQGEVIGVNTAIESSVSSSAGVGFCVPSNIVKKVVPSLIEKGYYEHTRIGISGWSITAGWVEVVGLEKGQRGVLVVEVTADSPAEEAGLRGCGSTVEIDGESYPSGGDIILSIDGETTNKFDELISYLARHTEVGQSVTLEILRNGRVMEVELTLDARPETSS